MKTIDYRTHASIPSNVIFRELQGEAVLLNLDTERYYALDDIGTRIWNLLSSSDTIEKVFQALFSEYDVTPEALHQDLDSLLHELLEHGLIILKVIPENATSASSYPIGSGTK